MIELSCKWHNIYSWGFESGGGRGNVNCATTAGFMCVRDT